MILLHISVSQNVARSQLSVKRKVKVPRPARAEARAEEKVSDGEVVFNDLVNHL